MLYTVYKRDTRSRNAVARVCTMFELQVALAAELSAEAREGCLRFPKTGTILRRAVKPAPSRTLPVPAVRAASRQ